jgi:NitT/TauT family transport system substrate-binding protein
MPALSRRRFLRSAALTWTAAGAVPAVVRAQASLKVGTAVLGDYALAGPIVVAVERGFFQQEGLAVEYVPFRGGPDLAKAISAGEILLGATGSTDIFVFREAGMPIRMVATHTEGNHFTLNTAPDVREVADLKGKAIGVTRVGAITWVFARMLATHQGWDPDRDVKIVGLGGLDAQLAALARKEIHAYVWGDGGAVSELAGTSKILMRLDRVTPSWVSQIQYASEDALRKQAEAVRMVQRGIFRAIRLMRDAPGEVADPIAGKLGWSREAVLRAHRISGALLPHDGTISVEALRAIQDTLLEHGVVKKRRPLDEHYTKEFSPVRL